MDDDVEITATVKAVRPKALLLDIDGHGEEWIPKSMITSCSGSPYDLERGDTEDFSIPRWLAEEKEIEE